jgi:hypothetical protein
MRLWIHSGAGPTPSRPQLRASFPRVQFNWEVSRACPPFGKPRLPPTSSSLSLSLSGYSSSTRCVRRSAVRIPGSPPYLLVRIQLRRSFFPIHPISSHSYSHTYSSGGVFLTLSLTSLFLRIQLRRSFFSTTSLGYIESFCLYSYTLLRFRHPSGVEECRVEIPRDVQYICVSTIGIHQRISSCTHNCGDPARDSHPRPHAQEN